MKENIQEPSKMADSTFKAKVVKYWDNEPEKEIIMEGATEEEVFNSFYEHNRTYRYCNGCYYKFADSAVKKEYDEWYKSLSEQTRFNMYYGDGIVD